MAPLRASLARSPPRLGRSQAGGLHPQTSRAAPPGAPSRTGPLLPRSPSRKASGHGCARRPGWSTRSVVHAGRPAPSPPEFSFSKVGQPERGQAAGLSTGGRQSLQRRRWADPGTARRAAVHLGWAAGLSTARAGSGRSGSSEQSNRANIFSFAQPTRAKPRQYWVSREPLYKKIGDPDCTTLCNLTTKMQSKQQLSTF